MPRSLSDPRLSVLHAIFSFADAACRDEREREREWCQSARMIVILDRGGGVGAASAALLPTTAIDCVDGRGAAAVEEAAVFLPLPLLRTEVARETVLLLVAINEEEDDDNVAVRRGDGETNARLGCRRGETLRGGAMEGGMGDRDMDDCGLEAGADIGRFAVVIVAPALVGDVTRVSISLDTTCLSLRRLGVLPGRTN